MSNKPKSRQSHGTLLSNSKGAEALLAMRSLSATTRAPNRPTSHVVPSFNHMLPTLTRLGAEGEDHINVSSQSKTEVGQLFSLENNLAYWDDVIGADIPSLRMFTLFLKTGMQEPLLLIPRGVTGGKHLEDKFSKNSFALQAHGLWQKVLAYSDMQQVLVSLTVPIDWYIHHEDGRRFRTITGAAYAAALVMIRQCLIDNTEPDFTLFFDLDVQADLLQLSEINRRNRAYDILNQQLEEVSNSLGAVIVERDKAQAFHRAAAAEKRSQIKKSKTVAADTVEVQLDSMAPTVGVELENTTTVVDSETSIDAEDGCQATDKPIEDLPQPEEVSTPEELSATVEETEEVK